ncbi:hypothetical protein [Hyphobacterium sp.]|uniref:hypothetical protein n=1 Tax=Hyphobacterium sp. TaxID=2004662 RepID=UPI003BAAF6EF
MSEQRPSDSRDPIQEKDPGDIKRATEEIFGINLRSIHTLKDLLIRPQAVFAAYAQRDTVTYTPALRLWLGLIGISFLVSFIWGGYQGIIRRSVEQWPPEQRADFVASLAQADMDLEAYVDRFADAAQLIHTPLIALCTGLVGFIPGLIGKGLTWQARLNITFAILAIASLIGIFLSPITIYAPDLMIVPIVIIALIYGITHYRGTPGLPNYTPRWRITRAAVFSVVTITMVMVGGVIMALSSVIYAMWPIFQLAMN